MKAKYFKEYLIVAIIWNAIFILPLVILFDNIFPDKLVMTIVSVISSYFIIVFSNLEKWYIEEKMQELQKQIDELKNKAF